MNTVYNRFVRFAVLIFMVITPLVKQQSAAAAQIASDPSAPTLMVTTDEGVSGTTCPPGSWHPIDHRIGSHWTYTNPAQKMRVLEGVVDHTTLHHFS